MNVFVCYGSVADQVTALRLQALAAVNGLNVYVPPAHTRHPSSLLLDPESGRKLKEACVVLGLIGAGLSEACKQELDTARALQRRTLVITDPAYIPQLEAYCGAGLVALDPANPDRAELAIVQQLKSVDAGQRVKQALIAICTLALGLLILAPQD